MSETPLVAKTDPHELAPVPADKFQARRDGRAEERAEIVAWLMAEAERHRLSDCISAPEWRDAVIWAMRAIERGAHREKRGE